MRSAHSQYSIAAYSSRDVRLTVGEIVCVDFSASLLRQLQEWKGLGWLDDDGLAALVFAVGEDDL